MRKSVPVHQNRPLADPQAAVSIPRADLTLAACPECGFVFNATFDPSKLQYDDEYENAQDCSPAFEEHMASLARRLIEDRGVRGCRIIEIGSGNGAFLRRLVSDPSLANTGLGFDPSHRGADKELDGRIRYEKRYYDDSCADIPCDVVVCRHVIEHVPKPVELLLSTRRALRSSPNARVFFETPCVEWILDRHVVWDVFYEHCSYFSAQSLRTAFEIAGFGVERVDRIFGGQYLWLEGGVESTTTLPAKSPGEILRQAEAFATQERKLTSALEEHLAELNAEYPGSVALWGAGAKGVTFANLVDPDGTRFACVVDVNPRKQGRFLPGTGHPIVGPRELGPRRVSAAVVLNPNYCDEIRASIAEQGLEVRVVDFMAEVRTLG